MEDSADKTEKIREEFRSCTGRVEDNINLYVVNSLSFTLVNAIFWECLSQPLPVLPPKRRGHGLFFLIVSSDVLGVQGVSINVGMCVFYMKTLLQTGL